MPRIRKLVSPQLKGEVYLARIKHPVLKRTVCFSFGTASEATANLNAFHRIWMNPDLWLNPPPPPETPQKVYQQWLGKGNVVTLKGGIPKKQGKPLKTGGDEVARLESENDGLRLKLAEAYKIIEEQGRELEHWRGKKTTKGPALTLEKAREKFMKDYRAGLLSREPGKIPDADAIKNIEWDLIRLCERFDNNTPCDMFDTPEGAKLLNDWIHSLKNARGETISPTRRMQIRVYALKMLEHAGANPDRKAVARPNTSESSKVNDTTKKGNGVITYLTQEEAGKVADKLPQPWADLFRVQCALGLRPDECITLHRNNFSKDLSKLTLAPLVFEDRYGARVTLTLKTGPRDIPVPADTRGIIKARLKKNAVVFPCVDGTAWNDPKEYNRQYKAALKKAAKAARIKKTMDSRIARRSCASWLMQANYSADKVAKLMGNSPEMILKHYGDPDVMSMDLAKAEV
ncbi:MAG TPA: tyrosine-type recombinase/integrase [Planctomycetota bacterium]|nr:tyrosine-type recombinase/integrase [Planctomycetota bacterium]